MDYIRFYGLTARPFRLVPDPRFYFPSRAQRRALLALSAALRSEGGLVLLTGGLGVGKTTLLHYLRAELGPGSVVAPELPGVPLGPEETLAAIARALDPEREPRPREDDPGRLPRVAAEDRRARLLVLDEAQTLGPEALAVLGELDRLGRGAERIRLVLVGRPRLVDVLAAPELARLRERIAGTCTLGPLEPGEIRLYLEHRLARVGWSGIPRFSEGACAAIHVLSGGRPRRVNLLCSRLLVLGALEGRREFGVEDVETAACELEPPFPGIATSGTIDALARSALACDSRAGPFPTGEDTAPARARPAERGRAHPLDRFAEAEVRARSRDDVEAEAPRG